MTHEALHEYQQSDLHKQGMKSLGKLVGLVEQERVLQHGEPGSESEAANQAVREREVLENTLLPGFFASDDDSIHLGPTFDEIQRQRYIDAAGAGNPDRISLIDGPVEDAAALRVTNVELGQQGETNGHSD